jgi:hypothetical protein
MKTELNIPPIIISQNHVIKHTGLTPKTPPTPILNCARGKTFTDLAQQDQKKNRPTLKEVVDAYLYGNYDDVATRFRLSAKQFENMLIFAIRQSADSFSKYREKPLSYLPISLITDAIEKIYNTL